MKKLLIVCACLALFCPAAWSGVVIEMLVEDSDSPGETATDKMYAQGEMLRMDPHPSSGTGNMSMLFRNDTLWIVNHDEKLCQTIDKKGVKELSVQIGGAMKRVEDELSKLPPEQRAMIEKMMKEQLPAAIGGMDGEALPRKIEAGATEKVGEYSCTVHTLHVGDVKVWDVCAADESTVGAASEALEAFRAMSRFVEDLREVAQNAPFASMIDTPFHDMNEVGGFPVRVRNYANGRLASETTIESITSEDLDREVFAVPDGYKVENLADQLKQR